MISRRDVFLSALGLAIVAWYGTRMYGSWSASQEPSERTYHDVATKPASATFDSEFEHIRDAEKIADQVQRCLAYPNPGEFNWDPKVIDASCRLSSRKMISWKELDDALTEHHPEILQQAFDSYLTKTYEPGQHGFLSWAFKGNV